jgi:hypothetical protein
MKTKMWAILALCLSLFIVNTASAQAIVFGLDSKYQSDYVTPNGVSYGDDIYRFDLTATFHGFTAGVTKIGSFGGGTSPYVEEWQAFIEKKWQWCSSIYLIAGYRQEWLDGPWDLAIPYMEVGKTWNTGQSSDLTAYVRGEYWYNIQKTTTDNGLIATIGLRYLNNISDKFSLSLGVSLVHDTKGLQGGGAGFIGVGEGYLNYALTNETTIYTGGKYYAPMGIDNPVDVRENRKVFEVGVKVDDFPKQMGKVWNRITGEVGQY